jgi:hypothetical protein
MGQFVPTRSALCSSSRLFAVAQLHGAIPDRKTKYFKITSSSIALHFGIAIALAGFYPYCYTESAIFVKGDRSVRPQLQYN